MANLFPEAKFCILNGLYSLERTLFSGMVVLTNSPVGFNSSLTYLSSYAAGLTKTTNRLVSLDNLRVVVSWDSVNRKSVVRLQRPILFQTVTTSIATGEFLLFVSRGTVGSSLLVFHDSISGFPIVSSGNVLYSTPNQPGLFSW